MLSDRKKEERNLRKQRIIDGALKVFNDVGIEKTTMDEIAIESGFGKATLYYYFTSKDVVRHPLVAAIIDAYDADTL